MTHRQFLAWRDWLKHEFNTPSRSDHYLMTIACEVRRVLSKNPNSINADDFRLTFSQKDPGPTKTPEQEAEEARAIWKARLGMQK